MFQEEPYWLQTPTSGDPKLVRRHGKVADAYRRLLQKAQSNLTPALRN